MPRLDFSLKGFSIKLKDWPEKVEIDLDENPCVVLTGLNASGKTLTMKMMRDFCDLLREPTDPKTSRLNKFALDTRIESMRVRFEYEWFRLGNTERDMAKATKLPWFKLAEPANQWDWPDIDWTKLSARFGRSKAEIDDSKRPLITSSVVMDFEFEAFPEGTEGGHNPHVKFRKREGIKFDVKCYFVGDDENIFSRFKTKSFREEIMEEFREIPLRDSGAFNSEGFRLASCGPWDSLGKRWREELEESTGVKFDCRIEEAGENYHFEDPERMIWFSVNAPKMQGIKKAHIIPEKKKSEFKRLFHDYIEDREAINEWLESLYYADLNKILESLSEELEFDRLIVGKDGDKVTEGKRDRAMKSWADLLDLGEYKDRDDFIRRYAVKMTDFAFYDEDTGFFDQPPDVNGIPPVVEDWGPDGFIPEKLRNRLIEESPDFALTLALSKFMKEIPSHPSSGQQRLLSMMSGIHEMSPNSTVLIDEPDLSLHIEWQERLISALTQSFPKLKFIIATHAPNIIKFHPEKVVQIPPSDDA
jgi:energy-coupling factor transporter ATP-binding protein EcfA2